VNLRALVELTAHVSRYGPNLVESRCAFSPGGLYSYWNCARVQRRLWLGRMNDARARLAAAESEQRVIVWRQVEDVLVDALAGGLVSRVWGAILTATDRVSGDTRGGPIAASVLAQDALIRNRILQLMIDAPGDVGDEIDALDRLRRRLERWTDLLLGWLVRRFKVSTFAYDPERAWEFGEDQFPDGWGIREAAAWDLHFVCLRTTMPDAQLPGGRLLELRLEIARTMVAAFSQELFLETGLPQSVGMRRLLSGGGKLDVCRLPARLDGPRFRTTPS
jgi:hypothetical protein